jgi:hypothetical protein
MNDLEKIKVEARKEEVEEQRENAEIITQKVEGVSDSKKTMEDSDKLAREALDNLLKAKKELDILKKDFKKIISDISVQKYLEKRGIKTLEEYVASDEGKDTDIAKRYQEIAGQIPSSKEDFRSKIKERGQAKDELFNELKKNETEEQLRGDKKDGIRTYSKLKNNAREQIKEIPEKEIKVLVDSLIDQRKEKLKKIFLDIINLKNNTTDLISNEDIIELQKYGTGYYLIAEDMFKNRIIELATETLNSSIDEVYDNLDHNQNIERTKESYKEARMDWIKAKLKIDSKGSKDDVFSEQRSLDNIIATENLTQKLEEKIPEIENIFSKISGIESNPFYNWIEGFSIQDQITYISFKTVKNNPISQYFNYKIAENNTTNDLKSSVIIDRLNAVKSAQKQTENILQSKRGQQSAFSQRNWISKIANKAEGAQIDKDIKKLEEESKNLADIEILLTKLLDLSTELDNISKTDSLRSARLKYTGVETPEQFKKLIIQGIKQEIDRLNSYIK